jgi:putative MATE family efflux protein
VKTSLDTGLRGIVQLAWPTVLSCVIGNGFRINDQFWVQGLGPEAQAAIGSSTVVVILNFALIFVAIGGSVPLVARATGAQDNQQRDDVIRHTALIASCIALFLTIFGWLLTPLITRAFNVEPGVAPLMSEYVRTIYLCSLPLVFAPLVDNFLISMGNTRLPMWLQCFAVVSNLALNPLFIYGWGDWQGMGIAGAALATGLSRGGAATLGIFVLMKTYKISLFKFFRPRAQQVLKILRLGTPTALSIAVYAGVYFALFALVIGELGRDVGAGFSIGFNVFESVSYPFFLGIAVAGASLVGRCLGANQQDSAWRAVVIVRRIGRVVGLCFALTFWFGAPWIAPWFTDDPGVLAETLSYVSILGWSQLLVSEEAINERVLLGAGHPKAIFWISTLGNGLRIPLALLAATYLGYGAIGVWWVINITTLLKGGLFFLEVQRGYWVRPIGAQRV